MNSLGFRNVLSYHHQGVNSVGLKFEWIFYHHYHLARMRMERLCCEAGNLDLI